MVSLFGTQAFAGMLHRLNLKPLESVADLAKHSPKETLIIVFGDTSGLNSIRANIGGDFKSFVDRGGAVLIASERQTVFGEFSANIHGQPYHDKDHGYHKIMECPVVPAGERIHPIFKGVSKGIVTDQPSQITLNTSAKPLRPLADFPRAGFMPPGVFVNCFIAGNGGQKESEGRVLIVGGHSVYMNVMLLLKDADNRKFTENCLDWLTNDGTRKYCLFFEEGKYQTRFDVPVSHKSIPIPGEEKINRLLSIMQDENLFNRFLLGLIPKSVILKYLFLFLSALVLGRLAIRFFAARYARERGLPLTTRTLELTTSAQPLLEQRYEILAGSGNLVEIASSVVRQWLETHGLGDRSRPPRVEAEGRGQKGWQKSLNQLWRLAWEPAKAPVGTRRFRSLLLMMEQLNAAVRGGTIRLKPG